MNESANTTTKPGVTDYFQLVDFEFTPAQQTKILKELELSPKDPGVEEFLKRSQVALGRYKIGEAQAKEYATITTSLARLKTLRGQTNRYLAALNNQSADVEAHLRLAFQWPLKSVKFPPEPILPLVELKQRLTDFLDRLDTLIETIQRRIRPGRSKSPQLPRTIFQIVEAYRLSFGRLPTSAHPSRENSAFEGLLAVILETGGIRRKELHRHIVAALKKDREQKSAST